MTAAPVIAAVPCGCQRDADGLALLCAEHAPAANHVEHRVRCLLDAELDAVVRELAGRSPTRIERKPGATGTFAIARRG
jgi:L-asparaginase II